MFSFFRYCPRCTTSTSSISSNNSTSSCGRSSKASYSRKGCWSRQLEVYPGHSRWSDDNVHPKVKSLCCNCSRKLLHHLLHYYFSILTICTSWKLYSLKVEMARTTENMYLHTAKMDYWCIVAYMIQVYSLNVLYILSLNADLCKWKITIQSREGGCLNKCDFGK